MSPERDHDPILDACLDEVLAGRHPPELTARILATLAIRTAVGESDAPKPPPVLNGLLPQALDISGGHTVVSLQDRKETRERQRSPASNWLTIAMAVGVVGVGLAIGITTLRNSKQRNSRLRNSRQAEVAKSSIGDTTGLIADVPSISAPASTASPVVVPNVVAPVDPPSAPQLARDLLPGSNSEKAVASNAAAENSLAANHPTSPVPSPAEKNADRRSSDAEIVSFVNAELGRAWHDAGVKPAPLASDSDWCSRLFTRVLGRNATGDESRAFLEDKSADRREKLVQRLLTQSNYAEEFARHWAAVWSNVLIGKSGGQAGSLASHDELERYLRGALVANKPYSEVARELLTATGSAKPGNDDYNPAVNFLLDGIESTGMLATSRVSRVLLGHQLQCAQCHDHPTQGWSQEQFWALNSFFRQMRAERTDEVARLANVDFPGQGSGSREGEIFYETPAGLLKTAFPKFIDGTEIPASGELAAVDRRRELARLVVQSDDFARATVNRVWAHVFEYGFTRPVDDLGPIGSPSSSPVLDRLATEFAAHNYDLRGVIRWAVLSDPFSRSSKITDLAGKDMPEAGELALFSRYYGRPAQSADVFGSLVQAGRIRKTAGSAGEVEKARIDWLAQFNRSPASKTGPIAGGPNVGSKAPPQTTNSADFAQRGAASQPGGLLKRVTASQLKFDKQVEHLFLAALARPPSAREQRAAADLLKTDGGNQSSALEDIWWALLNSKECVLDQ